ncbi:SOS response-associated peptidase [Halomonas cibimaris]|uniref:Abasic site processing protein n=1 Tax=Halomonas cibimaris TaxID=657012 RepID=A0ABP7M0U1_9GAMM
MTGRLYVPPLDLPRLLPELAGADTLSTSPNLAPRRAVSAVRQARGEHRLSPLFWGLTPPWLEVLDHAPHCARAESLNARAMFRDAFYARRCLVPAGGFYVWKPGTRGKQPYLVTHVQRAPLLLAGLWCRYYTTRTAFNDSAALITVPASAWLAPLSERLPAIIDSANARRWLDPDTPLDQAQRLLMPAPQELLGAFPVSKQVNNPANQSPACAHPVGPMLTGHP